MWINESALPEREIQVDSRVTLALERTLLAWMRTALAVMGFGFVVARLPLLVQEFATAASSSPRGISTDAPHWLGVTIILLGVALQVVALITHTNAVQRIRSGGEMPLRVLSPAYVVGMVFLTAGAVVAVYLTGIF